MVINDLITTVTLLAFVVAATWGTTQAGFVSSRHKADRPCSVNGSVDDSVNSALSDLCDITGVAGYDSQGEIFQCVVVQ